MFVKTLSVTALNQYIKKVLDSDFILSNSSIKGEISNLKIHSTGHIYFSLKDDASKISCIMFKTHAENLTFLPKDGMMVVVRGKVSLYPKDGVYQLYCSEMKLEGQGDLHIAFEKLKNKLEKEGLFDAARKKSLPFLPMNIGIVTSPTGAAVRDMMNVARRRNGRVNLFIYPSLVQGISAPKDLIRGINFFNEREDIDLIILARGGGSIEELWAFNDEELAYAIYDSKKPIVTGVGHEVDFTIADFVSDRRAPTPSAAAEICIPSAEEINGTLLYQKDKLKRMLKRILDRENSKLDMLRKSLELHNPLNIIINQYNHIDRLKEMLTFKVNSKLCNMKQELGRVNSLLQAHNPLNVLSKGYSIIETADGRVISEVEDLKLQKQVRVVVKDGSVKAAIEVLEQ